MAEATDRSTDQPTGVQQRTQVDSSYKPLLREFSNDSFVSRETRSEIRVVYSEYTSILWTDRVWVPGIRLEK